jgi:hypothetical protein
MTWLPSQSMSTCGTMSRRGTMSPSQIAMHQFSLKHCPSTYYTSQPVILIHHKDMHITTDGTDDGSVILTPHINPAGSGTPDTRRST